MTEATMSNLREENSLNPTILFKALFIMGWFLSLLIRDYFAEIQKQSMWFLKRLLARI